MNCLNKKKMDDFIRTASVRQLSKIWIFATEMIYYWGMYSLDGVFQTIDTYIPEIYDFADIDKIKKRSYEIQEVKLREKPDSDKPQLYAIESEGRHIVWRIKR